MSSESSQNEKKASDCNGVPPNALEYIDNKDLNKVFECIYGFWNRKTEYWEWEKDTWFLKKVT